MVPRSIGPYEILALIGRGGVGTVYRARHAETGALAAVKVLGAAAAVDPTAARRLAREFAALQALHHPNVVKVYEAGTSGGWSYLAMELVEGLDLRRYLSPALDDEPSLDGIPHAAPEALLPSACCAPIEAGHPRSVLAALLQEPETDAGLGAVAFPDASSADAEGDAALAPERIAALNRPSRVRRLTDALLQVCEGLDYVHAHGLVHRDLKPTNIMVDDLRCARLMDFGLVKDLDDSATTTVTGRIVGTYRYMAPEQALGRPVDARSDLYSLGVILYELLCGRPPFVGRTTAELWREILEVEPVRVADRNAGADPRLAAAAERLLGKDPGRRFQTARDVIRAIDG